MCNYIFKKGSNKGKNCPVNPRNGDYCSRHKIYKPKEQEAWNGKCKHIFVQGSKKDVQCTTKPRSGEYCSRHAHLHLPQNQIKDEIEEKKETKCHLVFCDKICEMKGGMSDKYCKIHNNRREDIGTIYKPEYKGDYMKSTGFVFDVNNSRYRPDDIPWYTNRVIGKIVDGVFEEKMTENDLEFIKDMGLVYQPKVKKLLRVNAFHDKVCDLCWKFCCTVETDSCGQFKKCRTCEITKVQRNENFERAYELVGTKCECEWCKVADEEEPEYFDEYLHPYKFERDSRVKCKIPMCPYQMENKRTKMCSLCDEGRINLFINKEDINSENYRQHIGTNLVLKVAGDSKTVIGKTETLLSEKIIREITSFDKEVIEDYGWKISPKVKVLEN